MLNRLVYLGYYVKGLDRQKLMRFTDFVAKKYSLAKSKILADAVRSSLVYNVSLLDYFYFRFFEKAPEHRATYAGTGFMYEYQLRMNPKASRDYLVDKLKFLNSYRDFVSRKFASLDDLRKNDSLGRQLLDNPSGKIVVKGSMGQVGAEVKVLKTEGLTPETLVAYMTQHGFDLAEAFVVQHEALMRLSPSGLNTVRIFTQIEGEKLFFLGARLRITINSEVDNMAAGNPAAPIDLESGMVCEPGVFSDITREDVTHHPITGESIVGFKIPFWAETLDMIRKASFLIPENQTVGWDIGITPTGPELIEGNHNWCKLLWQLPVKRGLKKELERFL